MKRRDFIFAGISGVISNLFSLPCYASPVAIDHSGKITTVDQGNANLCWLAAAAMIQSYQQKRGVTMAIAASNLGEPYLSSFKNTKQAALDFSQVDNLAKKLQMKAYGFASFDVSWWQNKLSAGPLWVAGQDTNGNMGHVKVLAGIVGDTNDPKSLIVRGIDPSGAKVFDQAFLKFIEFYERIPRKYVDIPNQIFAFV